MNTQKRGQGDRSNRLRSGHTFTFYLFSLTFFLLFQSIFLKGENIILSDDTIARIPVFKIHTIPEINAKGTEFCPVVWGNKLVFVSEKEIDLINYGESGYNKQSYLSIQYSDIQNNDGQLAYSTPKLFSNRMALLLHTGPISFSEKENYAIFTQVKYFREEGVKTYRPQLYSAAFEKNQWKDIQLLNINNSKYSFAHPALSYDGNTLYFVSNMEGGYGGKDIYVSVKSGDEWGPPENLGPGINTPGNEVFPYVYNDSLFFFSSDGRNGYGGLDLYFSRIKKGKPVEVVHPDSSINSQADDFGFFLDAGGKSGYFSSNRSGGLGGDDIYSISINWVAPENLNQNLRGIFNFTTLPDKVAGNLKVYLLNEAGEVVYTGYTDEKGYFEFTDLPFAQNFTIKTDTNQTGISLIMLDENKKAIAEFNSDKSGAFVYKKLDYKEFGGLRFLYSTDSVGLIDQELTKSLSGIVNYKSLPYKEGKGMKILLLNEAGEVVYTALVDENARFEFTSLPLNSNYIIMSEIYNEDIALLIYNEEQLVAELASNKSGRFIYVKLPHNTTTTLAMMDISGEDDFILFRDVDNMDPNDDVAIVSSDKSAAFIYHVIKPKGTTGLSMITGNNTGLCPDSYNLSLEESNDCIDITIEELLGASPKARENKTNTKIDNIYFNQGSSYLTYRAIEALTGIAGALKTNPEMKLKADAYADYTGTDFYNLWLSERRAQRIVDFLIAEGLTASRIMAKGHGNTNPINNCTKCTEEENRLNRRAELIIYPGDELPEEYVDSKKIVFRVQIFASKERIFPTPVNFNGMENVEEYQDDGLYKYVVELTYDYDYAKTVLLNQVQSNGFKDAFIVAFREGKRIPAKEMQKFLDSY